MTFRGSYPNSNCLQCHSTMPRFREVESHGALREQLEKNEMGCYTCHGLPHPPRPLRSGRAIAILAAPAAGGH